MQAFKKFPQEAPPRRLQMMPKDANGTRDPEPSPAETLGSETAKTTQNNASPKEVHGSGLGRLVIMLLAPLALAAGLVAALYHLPELNRRAMRFAGESLPWRIAALVEKNLLLPVATWKETGMRPGSSQCLDRRFIVTDFIGEEECASLRRLADLQRSQANVGDQLTGTDLWQLEQRRDEVSVEDVKVLNETRWRMLNIIKRNLPAPPGEDIYFDYSHLTSRTPGALDYSHGIHADSCMLSHDRKTCVEKPDNCCAWRKRSALLYLNGAPETTGGEFVFEGAAECGGKDLVLPPKCGLMVAFTSGMENPHGVYKIKSGTRQALAIWFTFDASRAEPKFRDASVFKKPVVI